MKKLILAVASLFACIGVNAQMTPIQKVGAVKTIATARAGYVKLNRLSSDYYICITATGNQFDDPAIFDLGRSKAESAKTIRELLELCDSLGDGESLYVKNRNKEVCITNRPMLGIPVLYFRIPGIAGTMTSITKKELLKFQKALEKYSE